MKILKRNYEHRNLLIFVVLSLIYLQAITSLSQGKSLISLESPHLFFLEHTFILFLSLITIFMIMKVKKYSEFMLLICLSFIVGKSFILLSGSFNKLTLVLNFIYLIFAFYFFVSWELEVALASFNPKFSEQDLEKEARFLLKAKISLLDDKENGVNVSITNLDDESCFLLLSENEKLSLNPSKKYFLEAVYEDVHFHQGARLVSSYDRGIGLVFEPTSTRASWSELYKVCLERGIVG